MRALIDLPPLTLPIDIDIVDDPNLLAEVGGDPLRIRFGRHYWNTITDEEKWIVYYHELAHCLLGHIRKDTSESMIEEDEADFQAGYWCGLKCLPEDAIERIFRRLSKRSYQAQATSSRDPHPPIELRIKTVNAGWAIGRARTGHAPLNMRVFG